MSPVQVNFTAPAEAALHNLPASHFEGKDPKEWHVEKVQQFAAANPSLLPGVTRGRVRAPAHHGGIDIHAPEHITVSFKGHDDHDIHSPHGGAWHVSTGR